MSRRSRYIVKARWPTLADEGGRFDVDAASPEALGQVDRLPRVEQQDAAVPAHRLAYRGLDEREVDRVPAPCQTSWRSTTTTTRPSRRSAWATVCTVRSETRPTSRPRT